MRKWSKMTPEKRRAVRKSQKEKARVRRGCSRHVWKNAKKRKAKYFGDHLWLVWGGAEQHVTFLGPDKVLCDCRNWDRAYNNTCCHIQAVKNTILSVYQSQR